MARRDLNGIFKRCTCPAHDWPTCRHPWWMTFGWQGTSYRFSLRRFATTRDGSMTETEARAIREECCRRIRDGELSTTGRGVIRRARITLANFGVFNKTVADSLRERGYLVLEKGWPDLLVFDGVRGTCFAIECKSNGDHASHEQLRAKEILWRVNLPTFELHESFPSGKSFERMLVEFFSQGATSVTTLDRLLKMIDRSPRPEGEFTLSVDSQARLTPITHTDGTVELADAEDVGVRRRYWLYRDGHDSRKLAEAVLEAWGSSASFDELLETMLKLIKKHRDDAESTRSHLASPLTGPVSQA